MRRTGPTVLLALLATFWLGACGTDEPATVGEEPLAQGEELDDRTISTRVQAGFYQNENVKNADIDVRTAGGVVTLDGTVPSEEVKQEALELARGVEGVVRVDDSLEVAGSGAAATKGEGQPGAPSAGAGAGARAKTAEARKQESGQPAEGEAGDKLSAGWITAKIQGQYFADQDVKGRRIDVDTTNGVVTLTGQVDTEQARRRAVEIAQQTEGVTRVDDQLRVGQASASGEQAGKPAEGAEQPKVDDDEITARIQSKYFTNEEVRTSDIDVSTSDGVVTLSGTVASEAQRDEAVSIARNTTGVTSVKDELEVEAAAAGTAGAERPGGKAAAGSTRSLGEKIDDAWITTKIQSKYFLDDHVKGADINVNAKNGVVTLEGTIESAEAKRQAVQVAENTEGVTRVVDRLKVQQERQK